MPKEIRQGAGSWLEGPSLSRAEPRGARLGLPAEGPGSPATGAARIGAFLIDSVVANLLAGLPYLFGVRYSHGDRGYVVYAAFLLQEFLLVALTGTTIGKRLLGIFVVRVDGGRLQWPWVLARTVLLGFLIPACIWDRDGRGLHDKASGAVCLSNPLRAQPTATATQQGPPSNAAETPLRSPAKQAAPRRSGARKRKRR